MRNLAFTLSVVLIFSALSTLNAQSPFRVIGHKKLNVDPGIALGVLEDGDRLGSAITHMGEVVPGRQGLIVGARSDDYIDGSDTIENPGSIYIFLVRPSGAIRVKAKIDASQIPELEPHDNFGESVTNVGDLNGDGIPEIYVGAAFDTVDALPNIGSIYRISLKPNGSIEQKTRITNGMNGFPAGFISPEDRFGTSICPIGDIDGNGEPDILVGAPYNTTGGALYTLLMDTDGSVISANKFDGLYSEWLGQVDPGDFFGRACTFLGDLDGTGQRLVAVAAYGDAGETGAIYIMNVDSAGILTLVNKIDQTNPLLTPLLEPVDRFGFSIATLDDLDGDGVPELLVGAVGDDDSEDAQINKGAIYVLYLAADGSLKTLDKISETSGHFDAQIKMADFFGSAVSQAGDFDNNGLPDIAIGARNDEEGSGQRTGVIYLLKLRYCRTPINLNVSESLSAPGSYDFTWDPVPAASNYTFSITNGSGNSSSDIISGTSVNLDTLDPGETYDWGVYTVCGDDASYNTPTNSYTTPLLRTGESGAVLGEVFPNPSNGSFVLSLDAPTSEVVNLQLFDLTGRSVYQSRVEPEERITQLGVEGLDLPPGKYLIELQVGAAKQVIPLSIQ